MTGKLNNNTKIQSLIDKGTVPNILAKNGMYKIKQCKSVEIDMAPHNHKLSNIPITNKDWSSLIAFNEFHISIITNTVKDNELAFFLPILK